MMPQVPQNTNHVADLLPAYINGRLDFTSSEQVQKHLLSCTACQHELSSWEAITDVTRIITAAAPLPSAKVLSQVWATIDAPTQPAWIRRWFLNNGIPRCWLILMRQIPIIHKSIWWASPLLILFGCVFVLFAIKVGHSATYNAEWLLALITTVASATGAAFIYGVENDEGLEITLSTPTSIRIVTLCRMVLVVGYNFLLAALASAIVAVAHGGSLWEIMQLWLGPMLLLSSFTLAISMILGSWFAVLAGLILETTQTLLIDFEKHMAMLQLTPPAVWQTNPTMLLIAAVLIGFAVLYAPRQPRLAN